MTSNYELLKRLELLGAYIRVANYDGYEVIDQAAARICELQEERDEAVTQMVEAKMDRDKAQDRVRELEAELDALKSDLSGYMSAANTYVNELHGVHAGTHTIVPVEPTQQPDAKPKQGE